MPAILNDGHSAFFRNESDPQAGMDHAPDFGAGPFRDPKEPHEFGPIPGVESFGDIVGNGQ
jgi:hypothetical protein